MLGEFNFGGLRGGSVVEFASGDVLLRALARGGQWFVVADFEGRVRGWRFADVQSVVEEHESRSAIPWRGPALRDWSTSLDAAEYQDAVSRTREAVANGDVYQANICRVLSAPFVVDRADDATRARGLAQILAAGNPAPFGGFAEITGSSALESLWLVSASPELFIDIAPAQGGAVISSSPIKGTAKTEAGLTLKDQAENVMITDLVRNDLSPLCQPGSVAVRDFLNVEHHPGLVHLVSTVEGFIEQATLDGPDFWGQLFDAAFPPGSVSGAPKSSALRLISELETHHRGPYCGGFGWVDGDAGSARLAVGIRSFWWEEDCFECGQAALHFGSGAGITWGSDPLGEWQETELKAARLMALAAGEVVA